MQARRKQDGKHSIGIGKPISAQCVELILPNLKNKILVGGLGHPSEKYEFVNWDD